VPQSISQTDRIKTITSGTNITTGKPLGGAVKAELVSVDWDKKVGIFMGVGGKAKKNGEVVYVKKGKPISKSGSEWDGITEKDINSDTFVANYLKGEYTGGRPVKSVKDITRKPNEDGSITISGTVVYDKDWSIKTGEERVSITYESFTDPTSEAYYEAPIKKTDVANWYGKALIDGKDPDYYFNESSTTSKKDPLGIL
jgi:hypothetical protein